MNKMYEYLKNHAYISYNKKSTYQFELSEERAQCIANKYDSLTDELQQENKYLEQQCKKQKEVIDKIKEWINTVQQNKDNKHLDPFISTDELDDLLNILNEV